MDGGPKLPFQKYKGGSKPQALSRLVEHKSPANGAPQNRQGGAALRVEGSISNRGPHRDLWRRVPTLHRESRRALVAPSLAEADLFEKGAVVVEEVFLGDLSVLPACGGRVENVERFACRLDGVALRQF
jgi:hypothetical protein